MTSNFSYLGIKTIFLFEIKDFFKDFQFTIIAPLITTLLFVFILSTLDKYYVFVPNNESYLNFLIPGIVISIVMQTSFNHLSEIIINMKQIGSFNDYLISPITRIELYLAFILASTFVSFIVGIINLYILSFFTEFENINYFKLIYYLTICVVIFSSLGALTGFLSYTWDVQSSISNFFIVPLSFLSGTFFSIDSVDEKFIFLFKYNPIYYIVNGFRSSFYDSNIHFYHNVYIVFLLILVLSISLYIYNRGYKVIN